MQHNIRRNRKVYDYLKQQINRLNWNIRTTDVFTEFIFENLSVSDSKEVLNYTGETVREDVLDNESVLMETLKFIGLLEVVTNESELRALLDRRKEIKHGKPLTDFDKILKAIMTVPNVNDKEK